MIFIFLRLKQLQLYFIKKLTNKTALNKLFFLFSSLYPLFVINKQTYTNFCSLKKLKKVSSVMQGLKKIFINNDFYKEYLV